MKPAAYVHIKFTDGEVMKLPFLSFERAEQFYRNVQKRHDALSVEFKDPAIQPNLRPYSDELNGALPTIGETPKRIYEEI